MTCVLALCLSMQAVALSAQRVLGHVHHHRSAGQAASPEPSRREVAATRMLFVHAYELTKREVRAQAGPGHHHAGLARHEHETGDTTAVYVDEDHGLPATTHGLAPARTLHDLDGLVPGLALPPAARAPYRWLAMAPALIRSHVTPPLERPPQA